MLFGPEANSEAEKQPWAMDTQPGPERAKARLTAAFEALGEGGAMLRLHGGQKRQQADTPGHTRVCVHCAEKLPHRKEEPDRDRFEKGMEALCLAVCPGSPGEIGQAHRSRWRHGTGRGGSPF